MTRRGRLLVVNRVELGRLIGCHADRITKYVGEGLPVLKAGGRGKESEFDAVACLAWERQRRPGSALDRERLRNFKAQADKLEQEIRRRAGELIEAAEVDGRWADMVVAMRERLLVLPVVSTQKGLISAADEPALVALVDEALSELASRGRS